MDVETATNRHCFPPFPGGVKTDTVKYLLRGFSKIYGNNQAITKF